LNRRVARWAPVPLRLIVGYGFMEHGFAKLSRGPDAFADILHTIGVPGPHVMAWATILTEVIGGLAVILGAFVALVALPMAALLVVATVTVHLPYGFSSIKLLSVTAAGAQFGPPGYEVNLLYLACLAALVLGGLGRWRSMNVSDNEGRHPSPAREGTMAAEQSYGAMVIGAGQGGIPLSMVLARAGLRTAVVEERYLGGSCVNYG